MITHDNIAQGSAAWLVHRTKYRNASDAPAMMGCSPYKTRTDLLHERKTGMARAVDALTQARFDDGHRFEHLSRGLAENIAGCDFYPLVGTLGQFGASFDGISLDESTIFEHKSINDDIRRATGAADLPEYLRVQMEQQLYVSGAERCLFLASKWDGNDELIEEVHHWYTPDLALRERILAGWEQFERDLVDYVPVEAVPAAVATPTMGLPAVSIQVQGAVSLNSNLKAFEDRLSTFIAGLPKRPSTDQEFADAEAAVKTLHDAEEALKAAESAALAQTASIDDMRKSVAFLVDTARAVRLSLDKLVKARKEDIRVEIRSEAVKAFEAHVIALNKWIGNGKAYLDISPPDFASAMKGLKSPSTLRNACDTTLALAKIAANATADRIAANLRVLDELAAEHRFLFADESAIVMKAPDDLVALIKTRIAEHTAAEAQRAAVKAELDRKAATAMPAPTFAEVAQAVLPAPIAQVMAAPRQIDNRPPVATGALGMPAGVTVTAAYIQALGFTPVARPAGKAGTYWAASDVPQIFAAIARQFDRIAHQQSAGALAAA